MGLQEEKEEDVEAGLASKAIFAVSCLLALSGFLGFVSAITAGKLSVAINLLFIFFFGLTSALLDPPFGRDNPSIAQIEAVVARYLNLLTSVTGKGIGVCIGGRMLSNAIYAQQTGGIMSWFYCTFITGVGALYFFMGYLKTSKLSTCRDSIVGSAPPGYVESQVENVIGPFAKFYPISLGAQAGLTPDEFNNLITTIG